MRHILVSVFCCTIQSFCMPAMSVEIKEAAKWLSHWLRNPLIFTTLLGFGSMSTCFFIMEPKLKWRNKAKIVLNRKSTSITSPFLKVESCAPLVIWIYVSCCSKANASDSNQFFKIYRRAGHITLIFIIWQTTTRDHSHISKLVTVYQRKATLLNTQQGLYRKVLPVLGGESHYETSNVLSETSNCRVSAYSHWG